MSSVQGQNGRVVFVRTLGGGRVDLSIASPLGSAELTSDQRVDLARALLADLAGYRVRYVEPIPEDELSCGCKISACICDCG